MHISVRAESKQRERLSPRKADLHRWRESFAEGLGGRCVEAKATRGRNRNYEPLSRIKAIQDGRLRTDLAVGKRGANTMAVKSWREIAKALMGSGDKSDRELALAVARYIKDLPAVASVGRQDVLWGQIQKPGPDRQKYQK
jgi:hypothetical protein